MQIVARTRDGQSETLVLLDSVCSIEGKRKTFRPAHKSRSEDLWVVPQSLSTGALLVGRFMRRDAE
jgi:hypothetical protein